MEELSTAIPLSQTPYLLPLYKVIKKKCSTLRKAESDKWKYNRKS